MAEVHRGQGVPPISHRVQLVIRILNIESNLVQYTFNNFRPKLKTPKFWSRLLD